MTKEKILDIAESLFFSKGFQAVGLKEICDQLDIKPASLYYHFPAGKEEIYISVITRRMVSFKQSIEEIKSSSTCLREALISFGLWYVRQPKMNMTIIAEMDMPELSPRAQEKVMTEVGISVFATLASVFEKFDNEISKQKDKELLVASLTTLIFSIHTFQKMGKKEVEELVKYNVDLFLYGAC